MLSLRVQATNFMQLVQADSVREGELFVASDCLVSRDGFANQDTNIYVSNKISPRITTNIMKNITT